MTQLFDPESPHVRQLGSQEIHIGGISIKILSGVQKEHSPANISPTKAPIVLQDVQLLPKGDEHFSQLSWH